MVKKHIFFFFTLFVLSFLIRSLSADQNGSEIHHDYFVVRNYTTENGLPLNAAETVFEDSSGFIWIGTQGGLARFDGKDFRIFNTKNTPELKNDSIKSISEDSAGRLIVGTISGLVVMENGEFKRFGAEEGLGNEAILSIERSGDNKIWLGTMKGLYIFENEKFQRVLDDTELADKMIIRIFKSRDGTIFVSAARSGVFKITENSAQKIAIEDDVQNYTADSITETPEGVILASLRHSGIYEMKDGGFYRSQRYGFSKNKIIPDFAFDRAGDLWALVYTENIVRFSKGKTYIVSNHHGIEKPKIRNLMFDSAGRLWVTSEDSGIAHFYTGNFISSYIPQGLKPIDVRTVMEDSNGNIWSGSPDLGITRLKDGRATDFLKADGISTSSVKAFYEDSRGNILAGISTGNPLLIFRENRFTVHPDFKMIKDVAVSGIAEYKNEQLAVSTYGKGVYIRKGKGVEHYDTSSGLSSNFIRAIIYDKSGNLFAGTAGSGLNVIKDGEVTVYDSENSNIFNYIIDIYFDSKNRLWIATYGGGLQLFSDGDFYSITTAQGLTEDTVLNIVEDNNGFLFIGTNKGVAAVSTTELVSVALKEKKKIDNLILIDNEDGMLSIDCRGGLQYGSFKRRNGNILFATGKGVAEITPAKAFVPKKVPQVVIDDIAVNDVPVKFENGLMLDPDTKRLEIRYTAPSVRFARKISYRYRLYPYEKDWRITDNKSVNYTNLAHGEYLFEVESFLKNAAQGEPSTVSLKMVREPYFTETVFFRIFLAFTLFSSTALVVYWYSRKKIKKAEELRKKAEMRAEALEKKYSKSRIESEMAEEIIERLRQIMEEEKIYRDSLLNLDALAKRLGCTTHTLSQVLNTKLNKSFNNYVNEFRINEVISKMKDAESKNTPVISIAYDCGFNTKATFNSAFKKVTGKTPSEFRKTIQER